MEVFQNPNGKLFSFYEESLKSSYHTAVVYQDAMYIFGGKGENFAVYATLHKYLFGTQSTSHIESTKLLPLGQILSTQDRIHHTVEVYLQVNRKLDCFQIIKLLLENQCGCLAEMTAI